jgi:hypothetical protein
MSCMLNQFCLRMGTELVPETLYSNEKTILNTPTTSYPVPVRTYHNTPHLPLSPDWLVHSILPLGPHSYINTCSLPPGILFTFLPKTLKMGQTSDPEMLVIHQKLTPGNNPKKFKQHYDHGGSLQSHILRSISD